MLDEFGGVVTLRLTAKGIKQNVDKNVSLLFSQWGCGQAELSPQCPSSLCREQPKAYTYIHTYIHIHTHIHTYIDVLSSIDFDGSSVVLP